MIKTFEIFLNESNNYNLYKGVGELNEILIDGYIKYSGDWDSEIRQNIGIPKNVGISATRNFGYAIKFETVIEFDTQKLSDRYKIVPFSENPDFYLSVMNKSTGSIKSMLRDKKYGKEYWDYKTNKKSDDFDIAEEIIIAKEIPIKYIKKIYLLRSDQIKINLLNKNNIPYEIISREDTYLSKVKYKNKQVKTYSQM